MLTWDDQAWFQHLRLNFDEQFSHFARIFRLRLYMQVVLGMPNSGIVSMLQDDKHDQLALVYQLFKRVEGGLAVGPHA
jgi:hypothetical protein